MLSLNEVKTILRDNNIRPSKRLGQNFLIDKNIQKRIIGSLELKGEDVVLEIGPGLGAITKDICSSVKKVIAIEKDKRLFNFFLQGGLPKNLEIIQQDILKHDFRKSFTEAHSKLKVAGNLPYYISSPILISLLRNRKAVDSIFITVQKEFAERVVAGPGTKSYGSISCFVQFYAHPVILFNIKKNSFYPVPKVDSCFMKIDVRGEGLYLTDEEKLFKIIRACFEKRRKTILNSLHSKYAFISKSDLETRLKISRVSPGSRPETIALNKFVDIANALRDLPHVA